MLVNFPLNSSYSRYSPTLNPNYANAFSNLMSQGTLSALTSGYSANQTQVQSIKATNDALSQLKDYANALYASSVALIGNGTQRLSGSSLQKASAASTDSAIGASALPGAAAGSFQVTVSQLAQGQVTQGTYLSSSSAYSGSTGNKSYSITVNGTTYNGSLTIAGGDKNQDAQQKLADSINALGSGITASVATNASSQSSVVLSGQTGAANAFSIQDTGGNVVSTLFGASPAPGGTIVQTAKDAQYSVNGANYTAASNSVAIDSGMVSLNLKNTTPSAATVTVGADASAVSGTVNDYVYAYNNMISFLQQNLDYVNPFVADALKSSVQKQSVALSSIGISLGSDGTLTVNSSKLSDAASNNASAVVSVFAGVGSPVAGIATIAQQLSAQITRNPFGSFASVNSQHSASPQPQAYLPFQYSQMYVRSMISNQLAAKNGSLTNLML